MRIYTWVISFEWNTLPIGNWKSQLPNSQSSQHGSHVLVSDIPNISTAATRSIQHLCWTHAKLFYRRNLAQMHQGSLRTAPVLGLGVRTKKSKDVKGLCYLPLVNNINSHQNKHETNGPIIAHFQKHAHKDRICMSTLCLQCAKHGTPMSLVSEAELMIDPRLGLQFHLRKIYK